MYSFDRTTLTSSQFVLVGVRKDGVWHLARLAGARKDSQDYKQRYKSAGDKQNPKICTVNHMVEVQGYLASVRHVDVFVKPCFYRMDGHFSYPPKDIHFYLKYTMEMRLRFGFREITGSGQGFCECFPDYVCTFLQGGLLIFGQFGCDYFFHPVSCDDAGYGEADIIDAVFSV